MNKILLITALLFFAVLSTNVFSQEKTKKQNTETTTRLEFSEYKILKKENKIVVYFDIKGIKDAEHQNQILSALKDIPSVTFARIYKSNRGTDHCQLISTNLNLIPEEIRIVLLENESDFNFSSVKKAKE